MQKTKEFLENFYILKLTRERRQEIHSRIKLLQKTIGNEVHGKQISMNQEIRMLKRLKREIAITLCGASMKAQKLAERDMLLNEINEIASSDYKIAENVKRARNVYERAMRIIDNESTTLFDTLSIINAIKKL